MSLHTQTQVHTSTLPFAEVEKEPFNAYEDENVRPLVRYETFMA